MASLTASAILSMGKLPRSLEEAYHWQGYTSHPHARLGVVPVWSVNQALSHY